MKKLWQKYETMFQQNLKMHKRSGPLGNGPDPWEISAYDSPDLMLTVRTLSTLRRQQKLKIHKQSGPLEKGPDLLKEN